MRFTFLLYKKDPNDIQESGRKIGVLVQDDKKVFFKSDIDSEELKSYDPLVDELLIKSLDGSIKSVISQKYSSISNLEVGAGHKTTPGDIQFLEDLRKSYQGKVQFSGIGTSNDEDPKQALESLYSQYVTSGS